MKITGVETFNVRPRWCFVKIETDAGISGWGEPVVEGKTQTVQAAVDEMSDYIIGFDPMQIEDIWNKLYRGAFYRGGPILMSALAGIDQALWDIKGKAYGVPVYELLGGNCRQKIRTYCWIGGDRPTDVAQAALQKKRQGYTAVKMNATEELQYIDSYKKLDAVLERVASIREAVGKDFGIAIDFHGRVHLPMAKILAKKLEEFEPMFLEEPVLCEHMEGFAEIANACSIPLATGERLYSRWDFKRLMKAGGISIIQPDLSHAGGITEVKKIAAIAECYDIALAPHCPLGPVSLAACLAVDFTNYNAVIQEQSIGIHYNVGRELLDYVVNKDAFKTVDGNMLPLKGSGLGVEVDEQLIREEVKGNVRWRNPVWRHADGSIAEW